MYDTAHHSTSHHSKSKHESYCKKTKKIIGKKNQIKYVKTFLLLHNCVTSLIQLGM